MQFVRDLVEAYAGRWRAQSGFWAYAAAIAAALFGLLTWLDQPKAVTLAAIFVGDAIWFVVWYVRSGRCVLPSSGETVVVALDVDPEGTRQYERITRDLKREVAALPLPKPLRILVASPSVAADVESAIRYRQRFNLMMVVWGSSEYGQHEGERLLEFRLNYVVPVVNPEQTLRLMMQDFQLLNEGRTWVIREVSDLIDRRALAEAMAENVLALIAIHYHIVGRTTEAVVIFRNVVLRESRRAGGTQRPALRRYRDLLHVTMRREATLAHERGDQITAIALAEELLQSYPENVDLLMLLARSHYYAGDVGAANRFTREIKRIDPKHPAVPANLAFFAIKSRSYVDVRRYYDHLIGARLEKFQFLPSISLFLDERYEEQPDEHAFLYGMAVVNWLHSGDVEARNADLDEFLDRTEKLDAYAPLRKRAAQIRALPR